MEKVIKKASIILIILALLCTILSTFTYAQSGLPDIGGYEPGNENVPTTVTNVIGMIAGIIQTIGIVLSVAILIALGIKYMVGSAESKAEYKKTMIPYLIGTVLIAATGTIVRLINDLTQNVIE